MQAAGVFLPFELETRTFEMQSHAFSIRFLNSRDTALGCIFSCSSSTNLAAQSAEAELADTCILKAEGPSPPESPSLIQMAEAEVPQVCFGIQ